VKKGRYLSQAERTTQTAWRTPSWKRVSQMLRQMSLMLSELSLMMSERCPFCTIFNMAHICMQSIVQHNTVSFLFVGVPF
jgi:hypothetical protein